MNQEKTLRSALGLLLTVLLLSACGPSQAELDATATQVAADRSATQTAAAPTATPTLTPNPTPTPTSTPTSAATPIEEPMPTVPSLGDIWTRLVDGMVMVYIPAGEFEMGSDDDEVDYALEQCEEYYGDCEREWFEDAQPKHAVVLDGFWIDQIEVTNAQYWLCVEAGACEVSYYWGEYGFVEMDQPVMGVTWYQAQAYAEWVGGQLPTEAQWEYAARGPEGWKYPWGNEFDGTLLNNDREVGEYAFTAPVGSYPGGASWCGALDMAGNVYEWVTDWYGSDYYEVSPLQNPPGASWGPGDLHVVRGGSWDCTPCDVRSASRGAANADTVSRHLGFRVVFPEAPTGAPPAETQAPEVPLTDTSLGGTWTTYLPGMSVTAIAFDEQGRAWIGGGLGRLGILDEGTWTTYAEYTGVSSDAVELIAFDDQDRAWVGTDWGGVTVYDGETRVTYTKENSALVDDNVKVIAFDKQGRVWMGTSGGVSVLDGETWTTYTKENSGLAAGSVYAVAFDEQGRVWIGTTSGGVSILDGETWTAYTKENSDLAGGSVYAIRFDEQGRAWIVTSDNVSIFDGESWATYARELNASWNTPVAFDGQGRVWMGTEDDSVSVFDGETWTSYTKENSGLAGGSVYAIASDEQGRVWVGTEYGGVSVFDGETWMTYSKGNSGLADNHVRAIAFDERGRVWIGTRDGVSVLSANE